jgi:hypothetical protein
MNKDTASEDAGILDRIDSLVEAERSLRGAVSRTEQDDIRLKKLEVELDQCWDLLRRRRAQREFGQDPDEVRVRPAEVVESYQQ